MPWFPYEPLVTLLAKMDPTERLLIVTNVFLSVAGLVRAYETESLKQAVRDLIAANQSRMAEYIKSPNYTPGRLLMKPKFVVVHSMAGGMAGSIATFKDSKNRRASHLLIGHDGRLVQMVNFEDTAWHAGAWIPNLTSIGIEHEGGEYPDGHTVQLGPEGYAKSAETIAALHKMYGWGEPSEKTVVPHKAFKATKCPSGLDVSYLIQMAQKAYNPAASEHDDYEIVPASADIVPASRTTIVFDLFTENLSPSQERRDEVARMQKFLIATGDLQPLSGNVDGYYGPLTQHAVNSFQKSVGIVSTSKFGWWYDRTREEANKRLVQPNKEVTLTS